MKTPILALIALAAMTLVVALTGCSEYPVALRIDSAKGGLSYSRDAGVSITINADK